MILSVPVTMPPGGLPTWVRAVANAINQLIARKPNHKAVSATYTLEDDYDVLECDTTSAAFTITLTPAAKNKGRLVYIKRVDASANDLTIDGDAAETIDGAADLVLDAQWEVARLFSTGTEWLTL